MNAVTEKPAAAPPDAQTPVRRKRRAPVRLVALVAVLLAALVVGNWWLTEGRFLESTDNAYVQGDIAVLGPRVEGDILAIDVADNQAVHAGDPLITLDPQDWQARLDQARGSAAEARAAVETAKRQADQARATIAQANATIAQAQAEVTRAGLEAGRTGVLVGQGWTSRQANEQAVADAQKANAQMIAARAQLESANEALQVAQAQTAQAQARLVTADAAQRLAQNNLGYTVIRAPFDGTVGNRAAQLGQHVTIGQQLISVTPVASKLYVVANFKETQLRHMKRGQKVLLTPDIASEVAIRGRVDSLAPATGALFSLLPPENATGNFTKVVQRVPVKIALDPDQAEESRWLRAGLSVTAEVDTRPGDPQRLGLFGVAAATLGLR